MHVVILCFLGFIYGHIMSKIIPLVENGNFSFWHFLLWLLGAFVVVFIYSLIFRIEGK